MQLSHDIPDFAYAFRATEGGSSATVNNRVLTRSFVVTPETLVEDWPVVTAAALTVELLEPVLALKPELIVLATGPVQQFPAAAVMAACLSRGIGLEVMNNAAAARTFNLLASEGRKVACAFMLAG